MDIRAERVQITKFDPEEAGYCSKLLDEIERLQAKLDDWKNKEGSVCPEDVGFVEYINQLRPAKAAQVQHQSSTSQAPKPVLGKGGS